MLPRTSLILFTFAAAMTAEPPAASDLAGLWEVVEIRDLTAGKVEPKRREYHMFTASHEMIILAGDGRKKIKKSLSDMTPEEVMTQQPIGAGFYAYRVEGDVLVRTAQVTLSAYYEGREVRTQFEVRGDTLITRDDHPADGHMRQWTMRRVE
jgi:hypothetical protein